MIYRANLPGLTMLICPRATAEVAIRAGESGRADPSTNVVLMLALRQYPVPH